MEFQSITVKQAFGDEWRDVRDWVDQGSFQSTYRGYNLEFRDEDNHIYYTPMIRILDEFSDNEDEINNIVQHYENYKMVPTGNAVFRGYFRLGTDENGCSIFEQLDFEDIELLVDMKLEGEI